MQRRKREKEDSEKNKFLKRYSTIKVDLEAIKVADLFFSRKNGSLIKLLKKRGTALSNLDFEQAHEVEAEINEKIKNSYDEVTTPTAVIIIFEDEDGPIVAMKNNETRDKTVLGSKMVFEYALLPSNIIWENRSHASGVSLKRHALAFLALFCLLMASFVVVYEI